MVESVRREQEKGAVRGERKGEAAVGIAAAPALDARARRTLLPQLLPHHRKMGGCRGNRKYVAAAKTQAEARALRILRILHRHVRDGENVGRTWRRPPRRWRY